MPNNTRESHLRSRAARQGFALRKSRAHTPNLDDLGGWRIVDPSTNTIVAGARFDLDFDDIETALASLA